MKRGNTDLVYWLTLWCLILVALVFGSFIGLMVWEDGAMYFALAFGGGVILNKEKVRKWTESWPIWED